MKINFTSEELSILNGNIINSAPISIMVINKRGEIVFVNEYFKKLSGSRHPLNRNIFQVPFFVREGLSPLYKKLLAKGEPFKKENCRTINSAGKTVYISITAVPLRNKEGEIESALSMALDVTNEVSVNLKLEELNSELEERIVERTSQLAKANEKLNRYLKMKTEFVADASHELRTPLTIIKLQMDLVRDEFKNNENISKFFSAVDEEINKITEILSDLTFMTSIEEGRQKLKIKDVDLGKILESVSQRLGFFAEKRKIKIVPNFSEKKLRVRGDAEKLERMFVNLIRNAIKYGRNEGWIKVDANLDSKNKKFILVNISDNGIGIPKKDLPHIFDRFYRSDLCLNYGTSGFGLGLAICKWITEQHKGEITVKSNLDKGSSFVVKLPIFV